MAVSTEFTDSDTADNSFTIDPVKRNGTVSFVSGVCKITDADGMVLYTADGNPAVDFLAGRRGGQGCGGPEQDFFAAGGAPRQRLCPQQRHGGRAARRRQAGQRAHGRLEERDAARNGGMAREFRAWPDGVRGGGCRLLVHAAYYAPPRDGMQHGNPAVPRSEILRAVGGGLWLNR